MSLNKYILVTPAKDEADNLPALIKSVICQSIVPVVWFIVDDNSVDNTSEIINQSSLKYPWIHIVKLDEKHVYGAGKSYSIAAKAGFDEAIAYCKNNNIIFDFIALADADMIFLNDYFISCINFLNLNQEYGIVSGNLLIKDSKGTFYKEDSFTFGDGVPYGGGRVFRKKAFFDSCGDIVAQAPDSVSNILALDKGWKLKRLIDVLYYQTRDTAGKNSVWKGYIKRGERSYYLHQNPLTIVNNVIIMLFFSQQKSKLIKICGLVVGYNKAIICRDEQLENEAVRKYCSSYKRVFKNYQIFLKEKINHIHQSY